MTYPNATELVRSLAARDVSALELADAAIARIERHDEKLNAVVVRDFERARQAASAADTARARGERAPLLGLPITVKECFNVAGLPTTWGIAGTEQNIAAADSIAVGRLRAAGAVILGKTNVPTQLADWQSFNPIHGTTHNPWDLERTPGGSSGGAAAALTAGFSALELGSDLNGSLRVPAHCCGVYAHRPTFGLVPTRGYAPPGVPILSVNADVDFGVIGPMARSAQDLMLALDVLAGPDDAQATAFTLRLPPPRHARLQDHRVLVLDQHPLLPLSNEVRSALNDAATKLERAGCKVGRSSPLLPDLALTARTFAHLLMSFFGADMPEAAYEQLREQVAHLPADTPQIVRAELGGLVATHRSWVLADRTRTLIAHQWRQLFKEWDIVLCPVLPTIALRHDHSGMDARTIDIDGRTLPYKLQAIWCSLAAVGGLPATALPLGTSSSGLPIGAQAIGPCLEDRTPIGFAQRFEAEFGGFKVPPGFDD